MSVNKATMARLAVGALVVGSSPGEREGASAVIVLGSASASVGTNVNTFSGAGVLTVSAPIPVAFLSSGPNVFPTAGVLGVTTGSGVQYVSYTGISGSTFTGCSAFGGAAGVIAAGPVSLLQISPSILYRLTNAAVAVNPGTVGAAAYVQVSVPLTGVRVGDHVIATPPAAIEASLTWNAFVSGNDAVTLRLSNSTASPQTTVARTWQFLWLKLVP